MIVGESGSGRSTFINSFCDQDIVETSTSIPLPDDSDLPKRELTLRRSVVDLEDDEGVKISMNVIDTPGFGSSIDNEFNFQMIVDYIKHQYDETLFEESRLKRNPRFKDGRVHCCLYFITPTGHGLKEIDVEFIKRLGSLVNVIPVIAKADSLTVEELKLNKKLINEDIEHFQLPIFKFDEYVYEEEVDEETQELNNVLSKSLPFAVMSANTVITDESTGARKRVRKYPWGTVDIEDNPISDFSSLKSTLLITHLNDFKDKTHELLYENYRTMALSSEDYKLEQPLTPTNPPFAPIPQAQEDYRALERQAELEKERLDAYEKRINESIRQKEREIAARELELLAIQEQLRLQGQTT